MDVSKCFPDPIIGVSKSIVTDTYRITSLPSSGHGILHDNKTSRKQLSLPLLIDEAFLNH